MRSRRKASFYIILFFALLFYWGYGLIVLAVAADHSSFLLALFAIGMFFLGGYTLYRYHKNVPRISLSDDGIFYGGKEYRWSQVASKQTEGKQLFRYLWTGTQMDGLSLTFDDGETLQIMTKMYRNADELRTYIAARTQHVATATADMTNETPAQEPSPEATKAALRKVKLYLAVYIISAFALGIYSSMAATTETIHLLLKLLFVAYTVAGALGLRAFIRHIGKDL